MKHFERTGVPPSPHRPRPWIRAALLSLCCAAAVHAGEPAWRIGVIENAPPMSYRDAAGQYLGFSVDVARAVCDDAGVRCLFEPVTFATVIDALKRGDIDIAAMSLLETPERRAQILLAQPYFRSVTLWLAQPGLKPGQPDVRVAVVAGSAQERFAQTHGWPTVAVRTNTQLGEPLVQGTAQAILAPMMTSLNLLKDPALQTLKLASTVMREPELGGPASFGISPRRPDLKPRVDEALEHIKRNGVYDRINTRHLPFRVN